MSHQKAQHASSIPIPLIQSSQSQPYLPQPKNLIAQAQNFQVSVSTPILSQEPEFSAASSSYVPKGTASNPHSMPCRLQVSFSSPQSKPQMGGSGVFIQPQRPMVDSPFWVAFLFGNVSRCNGCKGKISRQINNKPLPPPDDLILGHKEYVIFLNPKSGRFEQSWDKRNVYYHPRKACIVPNFSDFDAVKHIQVNSEVQSKFTIDHLQHLRNEFGIVI